MFRITKAFENERTSIFKIEGKVTDESLEVWSEEIRSLKNGADRHTILDFSNVWFISSKAVSVLIDFASENVFLLNCPTETRNVLCSAGLAARMIE